MSFFKRLFGGEDKAQDGGERQIGEVLEYKGYTIRATPFSADGQFQTCGVIAGTLGGEPREHRFVRADRFASAETAAEMALRKGRQIIDEQGDKLFG